MRYKNASFASRRSTSMRRPAGSVLRTLRRGDPPQRHRRSRSSSHGDARHLGSPPGVRCPHPPSASPPLRGNSGRRSPPAASHRTSASRLRILPLGAELLDDGLEDSPVPPSLWPRPRSSTRPCSRLERPPKPVTASWLETPTAPSRKTAAAVRAVLMSSRLPSLEHTIARRFESSSRGGKCPPALAAAPARLTPARGSAYSRAPSPSARARPLRAHRPDGLAGGVRRNPRPEALAAGRDPARRGRSGSRRQLHRHRAQLRAQ